MNTQPAEKKDFRESGDLEVHSIFRTIQGEGPFSGHRAIFLRLAGCNLQCPLCDTDYTSNRELLPVFEIINRINVLCKEVVAKVDKEQNYLVVITGGEPFRQNIYPITTALLSHGYLVQVETNGSLYQDLPFEVTVVCSPKTGSIHPALQQRISAYKYVLHADEVCADGLPLRALNHPVNVQLARPPKFFRGPVYLQPVDVGDEEENKRHLAAVLRSVLKHGHTLCLQTHKIIGLP